LAGWTSVKRTSLKDVVIAAAAMSAFVTFSYLRRGDICLTPGLVLGITFPFIILIFEWRLHAMVWNDVWRKFKKSSEPVDKVIEGMLEEADVPFERLGPWQGFRSFRYAFKERYQLPDGTRISIRDHDEPIVYVGPVVMEAEVERLKGLVDGVFD
jgi:hypothetical protein